MEETIKYHLIELLLGIQDCNPSRGSLTVSLPIFHLRSSPSGQKNTQVLTQLIASELLDRSWLIENQACGIALAI